MAATGLSCGMSDRFPDQGLNPGSHHWEYRVLATGPPGKSQEELYFKSVIKKKKCNFFNAKKSDVLWILAKY